MGRRTPFYIRQEQKAQLATQRASADRVLKNSRTASKTTIEQALAGIKPKKHGGLATTIYRACEKELKSYRNRLARLLQALKRTKILTDEYMPGLCRITHYGHRWIRNPENWKCRTKSASRQWRQLLRHLFAEYEVPTFLDSAWEETRSEAYSWYINIAQGQNIRQQAGLPIALTKRMAHEFMHAPDDLKVSEALVWARVLGLGGDERCARAVLPIQFFWPFPDVSTFWDTVLHFFINNPMLDTVQYGPLCDFINSQKYQPAGFHYERGERVEEDPVNPDFSMKGRTVNALMRQMEQWHRAVNGARRRGKHQVPTRWTSCGIAGLSHAEGSQKRKTLWEITELLTANQLYAEGRAMKHCVGSYTYSCGTGQSAIYSMKKIIGQDAERVLTIELRLGGSRPCIAQARGRMNALPSREAIRIMTIWASLRDLDKRTYL